MPYRMTVAELWSALGSGSLNRPLEALVRRRLDDDPHTRDLLRSGGGGPYADRVVARVSLSAHDSEPGAVLATVVFEQTPAPGSWELALARQRDRERSWLSGAGEPHARRVGEPVTMLIDADTVAEVADREWHDREDRHAE